MMAHDLLPVVMAVGGYLLGSIPFGIVVSKVLGTVDPRSAGSHNIGFTNVLRVSGKRAGLLTLVGDAGKGWIVGWAALRSFDEEFSVLVVTASPILGHLYPIFLGFRGGKGVATAMGAVAGVSLPVGGTMLGLWLLTVSISRISSAGASVAFVALPLLGLAFGESWRFVVFALAISSLILVRHKENLARLWKGTEPRIGRAG
jgi:glycerol-3-phosphate acyltransferase PlsY